MAVHPANKERQVYLTIAVAAVATGIILSNTYRPYVYENNVNDFGLADTIGSLVSVIGCFFFVAATKAYTAKEKNQLIIAITILYGVVWELLGLAGLFGTFDWKDMVAALISGLTTYSLKEMLNKKWLLGKKYNQN